MSGASASSVVTHHPGPSFGTGTSVPLSDLLTRVGDELDHLTGLANQMQAALSGALSGGPVEPHDIGGLQAIDRINQSLADLAQLMRAAADSLPADYAISTAAIRRAIVLFDLSRRLVEEKHPIAPGVLVGHSGDVDWL